MEAGPKDGVLIGRIGEGDEAALVALMTRHKQAVYQFVYRYLNNQADSAEVTEETFFKVYQNAARFRPKAAPKTWVFSIALNLARDRLRKDKKRRGQLSLESSVGAEDSDMQLADTMDSGDLLPSRQLQSGDDLRQIQEQIARLPEKLKFPFVFCVLEDHSYDECAAILKTNRKAVETRIYRARKFLRSRLSETFRNP